MVIHSTNMNKKQSHKSGGGGTVEDEDRKMRKLFVDKLSANITEDDIYSVFSQHGEIEEVAKYQDRRAPTRYFAFVVYKYAKDCVKATHNPCPIIRGKKCACMLAAIGKQFSGYKFFVQKGLLTEEEKQQHAANQNQMKNPSKQTNSTNATTSKHNKKQRQRRHHKNKNKNNSNKEPQWPRINIPSFKDEPLSQRSGVVSNSSFASSDASPIHYIDQPSWQRHYAQFDSHHSQQSFTPTTATLGVPPSFHSDSKSLHSNWNRGYNTPQPHRPRQQSHHHRPAMPVTPQHNMCNDQRYRSYSMNNTYSNPVPNYYPQAPITPQPNMAYYAPPQVQQARSMNHYAPRRRTQSMEQYYAMYNNNNNNNNNTNAVSFAQVQLPPRNHNNQYSFSPQPTQPQPSFVVPPMKQSISFNHLERSRSHSSHSAQSVHSAHGHRLQRGHLQQQSAPRLPNPVHLTPPTKPKRTVSHPSMFSVNSEPTHSTHSPVGGGMINFEPELAPDLLSPDLLMDLDDNFAAMGIEIGLTPTPPPPAPLGLSLSKASIDIDTLPVPTFKCIEDAKKASDKELEAGFTMLASPEATPSVHTEYNDSEDIDCLVLNEYNTND